MQKPNETNLVQAEAAWRILVLLRKEKIQEFIKADLKNRMVKIFMDEYGSDEKLKKYYKWIFGWGITTLTRDGLIKKDEETKDGYIFHNRPPISFEPINTKGIRWETEQTISQIYKFVGSKKHLIPSFQRGTAWTTAQDYCEIAFSIFQSIPLGLMYFWKINKEKALKTKHKKFKRDIVKNKAAISFEDVNKNELVDEPLFSIIDGQQRITGINVIINGTFEGNKLYFNESEMGVNKFKFRKTNYPGWCKVETIFEKLNEIFLNPQTKDKKSSIQKLSNELFITEDSLLLFYNGFFESKLIAICELPDGELEQILQVFIRTNQFGKKLKPVDIMKSMLVGQDVKLRSKIDNVHKLIKNHKKDFKESALLKLISVYFTNNPKINHLTFLEENAAIQEKDKSMNVNKDEAWEKLNKSITIFFNLISNHGFSTGWIHSENSIIPVINWIAKNYKAKEINNQEIAKSIIKYLIWSQSSKYFGSSTDDKLKKLITNLEGDGVFENWKNISNKESNWQRNVKDKFSIYTYEKSKDQKIIRLILNYANLTNIIISDDSIEHLQSQKDKGSDFLYNLSLLPQDINSFVGANNLEKKVSLIVDKLNKPRKEVLQFLHLTEDEVSNNKVDESRLDRIVSAFMDSKHNKDI